MSREVSLEILTSVLEKEIPLDSAITNSKTKQERREKHGKGWETEESLHHLKEPLLVNPDVPILTAQLISAPVYFHDDELGDEREQERSPGNGEGNGGPVRQESRRGAAGQGCLLYTSDAAGE